MKKKTDETECNKKVMNGGKMRVAIKSLVNLKELNLVFARVLHGDMILSVLIYSIKIKMLNIRSVYMNNLSDALDVRRTDKIRNDRVRKICGVNKVINKSVLNWFNSWEMTEGREFDEKRPTEIPINS